MKPARPSWDALYAVAAGQAGFFTTRQAAEAGYSPQLLQKHLRAGRIAREMRGVYRLVHYPNLEHAELVPVWLWSERQGVFSHQTALALHGLSDLLPARAHLTLPSAWRHRRLEVPPEVRLHHADLGDDARTWLGPVPVTTPARALNECAREGLVPDLLGQAAEQALLRGLVTPAELPSVAEALEPYGGLPDADQELPVPRSVPPSARGPASQAVAGSRPRPAAAAPGLRAPARPRRLRPR